MATLVDIANGALIRLGCLPIVSLWDGTKQADRCQRKITQCILYVLRHYPWKFSFCRAELTQSSTPPFGYTQAFQLPADFVRLMAVQRGVIYKIESGFICIENFCLQGTSTTLKILYIHNRFVPSPLLDSYGAQIYDSNNQAIWNIGELEQLPYDPMFNDALMSYLAFDLAYDLIQNTTTRDSMLKMYDHQLKLAKSVDSKESCAEVFSADEFSQSRFVYNPYDWRGQPR